MQARVDQYAGKNFTAVGVARGFSEKSFVSAATKQYGMKFSNALDVGDVTRRMYGVPVDGDVYGVILDPDGNVVSKSTLSSFLGSGPDKGKNYFSYMLDRTMEKYGKSAGGGDGGMPPVKAAPVVEMMNRGELGKALAAARKLPDKPADLAEYRDRLVAKLEERKKNAIAEIESGAADDATKFRAYQAAEKFLKAWAGEKEIADVKAVQQKLKTDDVIKKELAAKDLFLKAAVLLDGNKQQQASVYPVLAKIQNDYAGTTYARYAAAMAK